MKKEFEIIGCIEVQPEVTEDEVLVELIKFVESKGWYFGGGVKEIIDGFYVNPDGTKGESVSNE